MLYFAYGSNLLEERLKQHVPAARFLTPASLAGWQRKFQLRSRDGSAKCDVIRCGTDTVLHGAVFEMADTDRAALDEWESLGVMYHREEATVLTDGGQLDVFFYAGNESHIDRSLRPYDWYLASVLAGARRLGFPRNELAALQGEPAWPDPDPVRSARNRALIPAHLR